MAKINRGKQFEAAIRNALGRVPDTSVDRLADPMAGYAGIRNICDFITYHYPRQFYLECKAIHGNTLNFKSVITPDQWKGLSEKSQIPGVTAGFLVWFIDHDITVFVDISTMCNLRDNNQEKSLNIKHLINNKIPYKIIEGRKKRVLFEYNLTPLITQPLQEG